jgi:hypothetical protein
MFTKRIVVAAIGYLLLGRTPLVISSNASADPAVKVVDIAGRDSFEPNQNFTSTYRFAQDSIRDHHSEEVRLRHHTADVTPCHW